MKKTIRFLLFNSMLVISSLSLYAQTIPTDKLYLGQTPPGNTPQIFNLTASSGLRTIERITITSDGKEIYFGELDVYPPTNQRIKYYKYLDNSWQGPFVVFEGYVAPSLADNDNMMYMQKDLNNVACTFYSVRNNAGWSTPIRLLSSNEQSHYFQKSQLNNSYLSSASTGSSDICKLINNTQIQSLGGPINTSAEENDFFIARDESYIIFSRSSPGAAGDMFISYKTNTGNWTNPKKFGMPINTPHPNWEYGQFVSSDNKYLFFTRGGYYMSSYYTYWVKIDNIIDSLKHTNFDPYLKKQIPTQLFQVGQLINYAVPDSAFIDDDGNNTLTYSALLYNENPLPAWLSFNSLTRTFSGTPTEVGVITIKLTVKDNANSSVICLFNINVTTATGIEESKEQLPTSINLYQNYPNPFNPSTMIKFAIPKTGRYTLGLFNTLGELVKVISDKEYAAGYHNEIFNASGLSSGIYIYRLIGNNANIVRKMMLLR